MVREAVDHVNGIYQSDVKKTLKKDEDAPTVRNYFVNNTYISALLKKPLPTSLKKAAKKVINF